MEHGCRTNFPMGYFLSGFHGMDTILSDIVQMRKVEDLKDWQLFNY